MLEANKRNAILYGLLVIVIMILFGSFQISKLALYTNVLSPLIWLIMLCLALIFTLYEKQRVKGRGERIQTVFIVVTSVLIVYFLSGLLVGYANTPYDNSFSGILRNLWIIVFVDLAKLYYRATIIHFSKKKINYLILITLLFILTDVGIYMFYLQSPTAALVFQNFFAILLPIIIKNALITYLIFTSGFLTAATYVLPIALMNILLPIFPNYDWFFIATREIILAVLIYLVINFVHLKRKERLSKNKIKQSRPYVIIPFVIIMILMVTFMAGFFKYVPLGIMSNSMAPDILRGDVVIVKQLNKEQMQDLKEHDIIKYIVDGSYVVHRIVEVHQNDQEIYFRTKGDANNAIDLDPVYPKQIRGVVVWKIAKIGYPSVWLTEIFGKTAPDIEM